MNDEPVAWMQTYKSEPNNMAWTKKELEELGESIDYEYIPLYTHPVKELSIGEIHAVWVAGKYYELDKDGQVDEIKFTEFAYAILRKAQEK